MAMALEITDIGMAFRIESLKEYPCILNQKPRAKHRVTMERKAMPKVLESKGNLARVIFNSRVPSSTIRISPTVPNSGTTPEKSGFSQPMNVTICWHNMPNPSRMITLGIRVLGDKTSKR
jgi:hypothetical protein